MGAPYKVIFVFYHTKLRRYSIITRNTDWNSRELSPLVDTKRKFGRHPEIIRTLKTQISKLVERLVEWPASSLYRGPQR
jgi:hypothetical protein